MVLKSIIDDKETCERYERLWRGCEALEDIDVSCSKNTDPQIHRTIKQLRQRKI